jgi:hypothetical protein
VPSASIFRAISVGSVGPSVGRCIAVGRMMETESSSETSVNFYQTILYIPEDSHLHIHCRENLKSQPKCRFHGNSFFANYPFFGSERDVMFRRQTVAFFKNQEMAPAQWGPLHKCSPYLHCTTVPNHRTRCSNRTYERNSQPRVVGLPVSHRI